MKIKLTTIAILAFLLAVAFQKATAQDNSKPQVKILPANENGFIKILFLGNNSSDVQVKFYNDKGLYTVDYVKNDSFDKGFLKKYDIRNVKAGESFWIEISSSVISASYKMTPSKDDGGYVASLQYTELGPIVTASKD